VNGCILITFFLSPKFLVSKFQNLPPTFLGIALDSIAAIAIDDRRSIPTQHSDD
jgi:hypothetical protein